MDRLRILRLLLPALVAACSLSTASEPVSNDAGFSVRASAGALVLRNDSPARVHYVAVEQGTAALVDLNPEFTQWPGVAPGEEKRVAYSEVMGFGRGAEAVIVYWATAEPRAIGRLVVALR